MLQVFENDPGRSSGIDLNNRPVSTECGRDDTQETQTVCQLWPHRLSGLISRIYDSDTSAIRSAAFQILDLIQIYGDTATKNAHWSDQMGESAVRKKRRLHGGTGRDA